jgi:hypothetical protein
MPAASCKKKGFCKKLVLAKPFTIRSAKMNDGSSSGFRLRQDRTFPTLRQWQWIHLDLSGYSGGTATDFHRVPLTMQSVMMERSIVDRTAGCQLQRSALPLPD